jgi:imidazolonepropionase-like amidohydrolase
MFIKLYKALPTHFRLASLLLFLSLSGLVMAEGSDLKSALDLKLATANVVVIKNVTIIDTLHGALIPHKDVFIHGKKITGIHHHSQDNPYPKNTTVINGESRYLMPSLWDMHVHLSQKKFAERAALFIANGVTGVRDMNSDCISCTPNQLSINKMKTFNKNFNKNELVGPKILAYSSLINGFGLTQNRQGIESYVQHVKEKGITFIKTYNDLSKSAYITLAQVAKASDISIVGHIPNSITLDEALALGHKTIEHAKTIPMYCAGNITQAKKRSVNQFIVALENYDSALCLQALNAIKSADSFYVPTHLTIKMPAFITQSPDKKKLAQRYIPNEFLWQWRQEVKHYDQNPALVNKYKKFYQHTLKITGAANKLGVNIMLGTDANDTYIIPGFSAHEELSEFVKSGFSPLEAIKAATLIPARFLNLENKYGSVTVGKFADLLLLDKNPLENINNTRSINTIFYNGLIMNKAEINNVFETLVLKKL